MTIHRIVVQAALVSWAALSASTVLAADIAAGKEKAATICAACHGADGVTAVDPSYPKLAGQHADYLARALTDYKAGIRKNAIMAGMAATLSKEDVINVSAYYASLPSPLSSKK